MDEAIAVTCLEIREKDVSIADEVVICKENNGRVEAVWNNLKVVAPLKPDTKQTIMQNTCLYRDMEEYKPAY